MCDTIRFGGLYYSSIGCHTVIWDSGRSGKDGIWNSGLQLKILLFADCGIKAVILGTGVVPTGSSTVSRRGFELDIT